MTFQVLRLVSRKPGMTPDAFRTHYEDVHIPLLRSIAGDKFPLSHQRFYISRPDGTSPVVIMGKAEDYDYDSVAIITFRDRAHMQAFLATGQTPEARAKLDADHALWIDKSKDKAVVLSS